MDDMVRIYLGAYLEEFEEAGFEVDIAVTVPEAFEFLSKAGSDYDLLLWESIVQPLGAKPNSILVKAAAFQLPRTYGDLVFTGFESCIRISQPCFSQQKGRCFIIG